MKSCTSVTTIGMMVKGFDTQVTSATIPIFHDLRLDLPKAGLQAFLTRTLRNQDPGRTHQRIDDVAHPQNELLHAPADAGAYGRLLQVHLGLASAASALAFRREDGRDPQFRLPALQPWRQRRAPWLASTRTSSFSISRSGTMPGLRRMQFLFGFQFIHRLLETSLGLPELALCLHDIGLRHHERRLDLGNLAARRS